MRGKVLSSASPRRWTGLGFSIEMAARASGGSKLHCCVTLCNGDSRYSPDLSFHSFPKNEKMKRAWIHSIRRDPGKHFQITPSTRVCGNHFRPEDIYETPSGRRRLHHNSVPSKFSWTKLIAERPLPNRLRTTDDATVPSSRTSSLSFNHINPTQVDHNYCIVVKTAEEKLEQALKEIENLKTRVSKLSISKFGMERFKASSSMIKYYTGFSSYCLLIDFFHILLDCANSLTLWC
ncbi:THAP domain-containing protein 2-like [Styela clava]